MDKKVIAERLRALASDGQLRSKAACLRDVIDDVELALAAGVPRSVVVDELATQGLQMSLATFETTLRRIRLKRRKLQSLSIAPILHSSEKPVRQRVAMSVVDAEMDNSSSVAGSHNPADLDKIINSQPDLAALAKFAKRKSK